MGSLQLPRYLIQRTNGPNAKFWCRFRHPVFGHEEKAPTGIPVRDLQRAQDFSTALGKFIRQREWHSPKRKIDALTLDPIAATIFFESFGQNDKARQITLEESTRLVTLPPLDGDDVEETLPEDTALARVYEHLRTAQQAEQQWQTRVVKSEEALKRQTAEITNLQRQLGICPVLKSWTEAQAEYLQYGNTCGGKGGRPWSKVHARQTKLRIQFWSDQLGQPALSEIALASVEAALAEIPGEAPKTRHDYVATLRAFLAWCRARKFLAFDPLEELRKLDHQSQTDWRALTLDEIRSLLQAAPPNRKILYQVAVCTGLRIGELSALTVKSLDTINSCLRPTTDSVKNRKKSVLFLPRSLTATLAKLARGKEQGASLLDVPGHYIEGWWADCTKADIALETPEGLAVFHSLRKSFTTLLQDCCGASLAEAQKLTRHSTPALTSNVYTRTGSARLSGLVESLGARLLA